MAKSVDKLCMESKELGISWERNCRNVVLRGVMQFIPTNGETPAELFGRIAGRLEKIDDEAQKNSRRNNRRRRQAVPQSEQKADQLNPLGHDGMTIKLFKLTRPGGGTCTAKWICAGGSSFAGSIEKACVSAQRLQTELNCQVVVTDTSVVNTLYTLKCSSRIDVEALKADPAFRVRVDPILGSCAFELLIKAGHGPGSYTSALVTVFPCGSMVLCGCKEDAQAEEASRMLKPLLAPFQLNPPKESTPEQLPLAEEARGTWQCVIT